MTWRVSRSNNGWQLGSICTHVPSGSWYIVTRIGPGGGCYGTCLVGYRAGQKGLQGLRSRCERVPPSKVPKHVSVALAALTLTGKVPSGDRNA